MVYFTFDASSTACPAAGARAAGSLWAPAVMHSAAGERLEALQALLGSSSHAKSSSSSGGGSAPGGSEHELLLDFLRHSSSPPAAALWQGIV